MTDHKDKGQILRKLDIDKLNPMQLAADEAIRTNNDVVLLSPTGTGKTLAFLLPALERLDREIENIQALILVPSRELAIQIEQVVREMGSGFKANAVYGGRAFAKDRTELAHPPAILIGTPGRVADHLRRGTIEVEHIMTLVLDEFDKSLEVGFEGEMTEILRNLPGLKKKILTSATQNLEIPAFTGVKDPLVVDFLQEGDSRLKVKTILTPEKDKLKSLLKLLSITGDDPGIIFCNFKDSIDEVSNFLNRNKISHSCFHGGMEQKDRERSLIKFRNGTENLLLATDLAARGIDIPEIRFIIHYQLPVRREEFVHRNGRTARMHRDGTAYVLQWEQEGLPEFIDPKTRWDEFSELSVEKRMKRTGRKTLFISGGRKDKISKGDIAGLFLKQGNLQPEELGDIELKQDCAFVSVPSGKAEELIKELSDTRLKKKKVRIYEV